MDTLNIYQNKIRPVDELEKVELNLSRIVVDENRGSLAVLSVENKRYIYFLPQHEGTMLTYAKSGCSKKPHIPTIYHIYINMMESLGYNLEKCVLESCIGDVYYASLHWRHNKANIDAYAQVSFGDALIFSTMCGAKMYVIRKTIDDLEPISPQLQMIIDHGVSDE